MKVGILLRAVAVASVAVSIVSLSLALAQSEKVQLDTVLKNLQDIKSALDSKGEQKSLPSYVIPSAHKTRETEEAANQIARISQQLSTTLAGGFNAKAIYGSDDRRDYNSPRVSVPERRAADATVILVKTADVTLAADGKTFGLPGGNIIEPISGAGLCTPEQAISHKKPVEPFYNQPNPGFCSGFRITKNRILTAGHCIKSASDCMNTQFVFGFNISRTNPEQGLSSENLYRCKSIIGGALNPNGADWRLIEVDRDMTYGSDVVLRNAATAPKLQPGSGVTVVGYPLGLPVKIASGATVRGFGSGFFVANLDTYEGNSGSAVFNTERLSMGELLVEGILVRGENDFDLTTPCYISKRCPTNGCRGEDVTLATEIVVPPP